MQNLTVQSFETHPDRYKHWKLSFDGDVARLVMDVQEDGGLVPADGVGAEDSISGTGASSSGSCSATRSWAHS